VSQKETPQVAVSPRTLALIDELIGERMRRHYRTRDAEVYRDLVNIRVIAKKWELTHEHVSGIVIGTCDGALSEVMTTDEAAAAAGVDRATICWHLRRGHLSGERRGRRWFVTTDALAAYMIRRAA
jgi:excisionase family DNA binding protein